MSLRPGRTVWWCETCERTTTTTMAHVETVKCRHCGALVRALAERSSKVQGKTGLHQHDLGLELLKDAQR